MKKAKKLKTTYAGEELAGFLTFALKKMTKAERNLLKKEPLDDRRYY